MSRIKAVTFRDKNYEQRPITIGDEILMVKNGAITTNNPDHIKALEKMSGLVKVESK